jgi:hypothetical protein
MTMVSPVVRVRMAAAVAAVVTVDADAAVTAAAVVSEVTPAGVPFRLHHLRRRLHPRRRPLARRAAKSAATPGQGTVAGAGSAAAMMISL